MNILAKKKQRQQQRQVKPSTPKEEGNGLFDQLSSDVLAKLKETKKQLMAVEQEKEEERQAQLAFEKKQKEKINHLKNYWMNMVMVVQSFNQWLC